MSITANITEKNYKKLSLFVGLARFSYCIFDTLNNRATVVNSIEFSDFSKSSKIEDYYNQAFLENEELTQNYDEILVLHDNNLNAFVPKALFDQNNLGSYLQYNSKVFESDFFAFDELPYQEINNVYIPYANINNYLIDRFGTFNYKHASTVLVSKLLYLSINVEQKLVFVHLQANKFELVVVQNQKLLFFNSFEYQTKEDFIYYLLFTAEQLNLNPENFELYFLGDVTKESEFYQIAYKFIRNVDLLDVSGFQENFSAFENSKHFILFQS